MNTSVGRGLADRITEAQELLRRDPQRSLQLVSDVNLATVTPEEALEVLSIRSRANIHLGDYEAGEPNARSAIALAQQYGLRIKEGLARNEAGVFHFVRGEFDDALNQYAAAEQLLRDTDEAGRARVFVNIANVYTTRGDYLQALMAYEQALAIAKETGELLTQAKVYSNMAGLYRTTLGSSELAASYLAEAAELYTTLDDKVGLGKCLVNQANQLMVDREYAGAADCFRRSLKIREAFSEPDDLIMTYDGLVSALLQLGEFDQAEEVYAKAQEAFRDRAMSRRAEEFLRMSESRILSARGRVEEAVAIAEQVQSFMTEYGQAEFASELRSLIAESYRHLGRHEQASELYRELLLHRDMEARRQATHRMEMIRAQMDLLRSGDQNTASHLRRSELLSPKDRLSRAEAANEEFIAVLTHELKSPLHTLRSVMGLLARADAVSKEERQEYGREMEMLATRLIDQVSATLATARQKHGGAFPVVNVRTVWEHVLKAVKQGSDAENVTLSWSFDRSEYLLRADEQLLVTVLENLVSNAIKFGGAGSTVTVTVSVPPSEQSGERLLLEVIDTGPGLEKEDLATMFRPFQTLSARPIGKAGSSGLGLFLVRRTVENLGGRVWAENRSNGAVFHVELPLASDTHGAV